MREVIIHIVIHKTGSTAIQNDLNGYDDGHTLYIPFSYANHTIPILTIFEKGMHNFHFWRDRGVGEAELVEIQKRELDILEKALDRAKHRRFIISGEGIRTLSPAAKTEFISFLQKKELTLKIVCFVRNPLDFAKSSVQQVIKGGVDQIGPILPDFQGSLQQFSDLVGQSNVTVMDYNEAVDGYGDITNAFRSVVGLNLNSSSGKAIRYNNSLSKSATQLVYRLNQLPIVTQGDEDKLNARSKFINLLADAFPKTASDQLILKKAGHLLHPKIHDDCAYLRDNFAIDYNMDSNEMALEKYHEYLMDIPKEIIVSLNALCQQNGLAKENRDELDQMLIDLYEFCLTEVKVQRNGSTLWNGFKTLVRMSGITRLKPVIAMRNSLRK